MPRVMTTDELIAAGKMRASKMLADDPRTAQLLRDLAKCLDTHQQVLAHTRDRVKYLEKQRPSRQNGI